MSIAFLQAASASWRCARLSDLADADAVRDGDCAEVVALQELGGELTHDVLGHPFIGLVLETDDLPPARLRADGAEERGDGACALVLDLRHDRGEVDRILGEPEGAARNRGDERDLVAVCERVIALDVCAVDGVDEPGRLLAEAELRPDVLDARSIAELDILPAGSGELAEAGKKPHRHSHAR